MISYYGHSGYDIAATNALLRQVRGALPAATWVALQLTDAGPLAAPFGADISRDFGIDAVCQFQLHVVDTANAHKHHPAAIAALYRNFAKGRLVITWELDSIVPDPNVD